MAISVHEIMSRELFSLYPSELVEDALGYMLALGITSAPVIEEDSTLVGMVALVDLLNERLDAGVVDCMSSPVVSIRADASIAEAGRLIGETSCHHLVVTDIDDRVVGLISSLDVIRGLVGLPATHSPTSPHYDSETGTRWTDDSPFELAHAEVASEEAGVFALIRGGVGVEESPVWVESTTQLRKRLVHILTHPTEQSILLQKVLAFRQLRFRTAIIAESSARERVTTAMLGQVRRRD